MTTMFKQKQSPKVYSVLNDEFQRYLKRQTIKTTFNGNEVAAFSWYKKAMGIA